MSVESNLVYLTFHGDKSRKLAVLITLALKTKLTQR